MREIQGGEARYRAFVSYSHRDQASGRRIHRWLERYAVPRRLVGRITARGETPKRVAPVFRDREELSAAHDLTSEIRHALANSGALIVVCSPNAKASQWVTREIELFRELHPERPVLAALIAGEPEAAFPEALTHARSGLVEPLAADFRREGDGPRLALLKLVAGVLGLGVDELIQRDAQRRLRNVMAVTGAAFAAVLAMALLTTLAVTSRVEAERQRAEADRQREVAERQTLEVLRQSDEVRRQRGVALAQEAEANLQRAEAQRQRGEAEDLVEFMLTDLRDRLKGVGRLDVLSAVNDRTLDYYAGQDVPRMPAESQMRYARILLAIGEDELAKGKADSARQKFQRAQQITSSVMSEMPSDPDRIWAQGQTEYWLGYASYHQVYLARGDAGAAAAAAKAKIATHWSRYTALARALTRSAPNNARYRAELAYAEGNLCTLALRERAGTALGHCQASLIEMQAASRLPGRSPRVDADIVNRQAWLADAFAARGDWASARRERLEQERGLDRLLGADPRNADLTLSWIALQRGLAQVEANLRQPHVAEARIVAAQRVISELIEGDPHNASWRRRREALDADLANIKKMGAKNE
ncbi:MAG: hypothetical protein DI570_15280 [Phenylobacterium zucineum]|nr:MAG: hypothetical protein DI570_15280 [Phenylobacterium zucineum]